MRGLALIVILASQLLAPVSHAEQWGLGFAGGRLPALSVRYQGGDRNGVHTLAHYSTERVWFVGDYHRSFVPAFGYFADGLLSLFIGVGVDGEARSEDASDELYHLRLPVGVEYAWKGLGVQAFAQTAGRAGPFPKTAINGEALAGVRALF